MGLNTYTVKWKTDTNPHYPGVLAAMDIREARVLTSSEKSAQDYILREKKGVVVIISVELSVSDSVRGSGY